MAVTARYVMGISGASGGVYALRLLEFLLAMPCEVYLTISPWGRKVLAHETGLVIENKRQFSKIATHTPHPQAELILLENSDLFAGPASGSFQHQGMVIAPCSMKTIGALAAGMADNLMLRAADVCLKEKRPLILLVRESPLSAIHLKNMYTLAQAGATIMPAAPSFYLKPKSINDIVDSIVRRILDHLQVAHANGPRWGD